jgi:hypothetical protein
MDPEFDFIAYAWILGILMVVVAVVGYFVCAPAIRRMMDLDRPDGLGHR